MKKQWFSAISIVVGIAVAFPQVGFACTACYGGANPAVAKAMNLGILVMLGVTFGVLGSIMGFAYYLWKRARMFPVSPENSAALEKNEPCNTDSSPSVSSTISNHTYHSPAWHLHASHAPSGIPRPHAPFARSAAHHSERPSRG